MLTPRSLFFILSVLDVVFVTDPVRAPPSQNTPPGSPPPSLTTVSHPVRLRESIHWPVSSFFRERSVCLLTMPRHSIRSIVASHFILSLRQVFLADDPNNMHFPSLHASAVLFAGNLGAPIQLAGGGTSNSDGELKHSCSNPLAVGLLDLDGYADDDHDLHLTR